MQIIYSLTLVFSLSLAWSLQAQEEAEQPPETSQSNNASKSKMPKNVKAPSLAQYRQVDINRFEDKDEILSLMAGDSQFPALLSEQNTFMVKGTAILLADWTLSPSQSAAFSQLRHELNDHGWVTLAASSHDPMLVAEPLNEESAKQWMERADSNFAFFPEQAQQDYQMQMQMRLMALLNQAENYPGVLLVIAQGVGAASVVNHFAKLADDEDALPDILVLVQPYIPDTKANKKLATTIAELPVAILDIWSDFDNPWALATREKRQKMAKKKLTLHYRQRQLFGDHGWEQRDARLMKEILAYSKYLGW
ncbi:DUF3530 family protein [Catenovulum sp. SM1970]|uniref:DUF3530 family protein n=1 Tax=Marinifaba aquimaris TaxID=2741323 RepID=UPI0015743201|nr:DUF3530 family protein [Marinifaba aquimaris]NTS77442.1 DUF3530 family protein [Marinifaba aquimaris]